MIGAGLATASEAIFDLDFHAVMHWGQDPVLEKHYVPTRSQRARSVLTFFAQDTGTHNLVYANADLSKATQNREAIAFCDHWKAVSGADPKMLIMDQKVTTQAILGELDARGVKFATLRMRSPSLMRHINGLTSKDYKTDHPGPARAATTGPASHEDRRRQADQLPRHRPPAHRHRPGPRRSPPSSSPTTPDHHQGPDQPVRPPDDHRAAPRRDHPGVLRRRPVLHRQPQRRPRRRPVRPGPGPARRVPRPARPRLRHRHPRHPPAPLPRHPRNIISDGDTASPSPSTAAPTHPSCASPTSAPTPPSPGGRTAASASSSASRGARFAAWKSALSGTAHAPSRLTKAAVSSTADVAPAPGVSP